MLGRSIKYQLTILTLLFSIFVSAVLLQIYYTHKMQQDEILQMQRSHDVISGYLELEEEENKIYQRLGSCADNPKESIEKGIVAETDKLIAAWFEKLKEWKKNLGRWQERSNISLQGSFFDEIFVENKKRQAEAYRNALILIKEGKPREASAILRIESSFLPPVNQTILSILNGIRIQIQNDRDLMRRYYFTTAFAVLVALVSLVLVSISIFRNITSRLAILKAGAGRISAGDYSETITLTAPVELAGLADSFNEMQSAIMTRDMKIREDAEKIQKLNSILEQKVEDRNKTILQQNTALKRKNEELEQILYAASHDLRTPLISIQGFSEELKLSCESLVKEASSPDGAAASRLDEIVNGEIKFALNYIINGSKRMESLLEALLRISRMGRESLQIKRLDMNELISNVKMNLEYQLNEAGAELAVKKLQACYADENQFQQVFTNLISNAIKYRDPSRKCVITISSEADNEFTRYSVADNGIGIEPEHLARVFHAFYRVDDEFSEGEGVGLAIVSRALDLHNGRAYASSEYGKGSIFTIEVPNDIKQIQEKASYESGR